MRQSKFASKRQLTTALLALAIGPTLGSAEERVAPGEQLFRDNCAECHQPDGMGIAGIYPALATSEVVRGSGVDVALQLIIGRGEMPSFSAALRPHEMAAVINYVRNAWGNKGNSISVEEIAALLQD